MPFNRGNLPNGFLICSAEDMAHYLIAQLNDGRYGNVSVLSPQGVAAMHQPAVPTRTPGEYYGMAWHVGALDGMPAVYHSGENANFSTHIILIPEEKLGVVVMMNTHGLAGLKAFENIAEGVLAVVRGKQPRPYETPMKELAMLAGSVIVPAVLSFLWIAWMAYRFIHRRKQSIPARRAALWIVWVIVLPLIVDLGLLWVLLLGIPKLWGLPLGGMAAFLPDMFTLVIGSTVALVGWGLARTVLTLRGGKSQPQAML
jgi:hypothetical protein